MRAARSIAAVDSHTEGMPTRVVTGGVGADPGRDDARAQAPLRGASMDDLRLLLMREPRGHGAMSGAILQPPTRRTPTGACCSSRSAGCLPMCGHGTIGVATVLVETGMVAVTRAGDRRAARHAGRARRGARRGARAAARGRSRCATSRASCTRATATVDVPGLGRVVYDMAFGGNFYALAAGGRGRAGGRSGARGRADRGGPRDHRRDRRRRPPGAPGGRADRRLHARRLPRGRAATAPTRARRPRSIPAGSTARRAARARRRGSPSCTRAASWRSATRSSTSR